MTMPPLPWLEPGDSFPGPDSAWTRDTPAPGLLAAGGALDTPTLLKAYRSGVFPWFSTGQPILWWCPDPRMVLRPEAFRLHRSLRRTVVRHLEAGRLDIRINHDFSRVIRACASSPRKGQTGTWIVPEMVEAYCALHLAGFAHSLETWIDGELAGGLYFVAIGSAWFGESMFAQVTDASKMALAALVALSRHHEIGLIDCQQNTRHLASLGASEIPRPTFLAHLAKAVHRPISDWRFQPVYWNALIN